MKGVFIFFVLAFCSLAPLQGQQFQWGKTFNSIGVLSSYSDMTLDASGNIYVCGSLGYNNSPRSLDIGNGSKRFIIDETTGGHFLAKYDANGNFVWGKRFGERVIVYKVRMDTNGDVILFGIVNDNYYPLVFNPEDPQPITLTAYGEDMFFAKISSADGAVVWLRQIQTIMNDNNVYGGINFFSAGLHFRDNSVAVDNQGNILICGSGSGIVDVDVQRDFGENYDFGQGVEFLLKYSNSGELIWFMTNGDVYNSVGFGLAVDAANSVYYFGRYNQDFSDPLSDDMMYIIKLSDSVPRHPKFSYFKTMPVNSTFNPIAGSSGDYPSGMVLDKNGDVYIRGYLKSRIDFNQGSSSGILSMPGGNAGLWGGFIAKYSANGTFVWAKNAGTTPGSRVHDIGINDNNQLIANIGIAETFAGSGIGSDLDMGSGRVDTFGNFLAIYDGNADLVSYKRLHDPVASRMAVSKAGIFLCGQAFDSFNFNLLDPNGLFEIKRPTSNAIYIAKYNFCKDNIHNHSATICQGDSYAFGTDKLSLPGSYTHTFKRGVCDSMVVLDLSVVTLDTTISEHNGSLEARQSNAAYQWIDCSDDSEIPGATGQHFSPQVWGAYKVRITQGDCQVFSACHAADANKIGEKNWNGISVFPNPAKEVLTIRLEQSVLLSQWVITDISGKVMKKQVLNGHGQTIVVDLDNIAPGIYFLRLTDQNQEPAMFKFVVRE